jgi:hypothetical protein
MPTAAPIAAPRSFDAGRLLTRVPKRHTVEWLTAAPLWDKALTPGNARHRFRQPAVLRFDGDSFMEEVQKLLSGRESTDESAGELADLVARPETWRDPAVGWVPDGHASLGELLKLYQPAHGRFYLVASSLVCRRPGLPPRKVDAAEERASMVVRRLVPIDGATFDPSDPATYIEHGWVGDRQKGRWESVETAGGLVEGEERLPAFQLTFHDDEGRKRHLHAGVIPVAGREVYEGHDPGPAPSPPTPDPEDPFSGLSDPRKSAWTEGPSAALHRVMDRDSLLAAFDQASDPTAEATALAREILTFFCLDLADFFQDHLPQLWSALQAGSSTGLPTALKSVYNRLAVRVHPISSPDVHPSTTWRQAVLDADGRRSELLRGPLPVSPLTVFSAASLVDLDTAASALASGTHLDDDVLAALDAVPGTGGPGLEDLAAAAAELTADEDAGEGAVYCVRMVYERPRCGVLDRPVLSAPSRPFRLAGFFDPDAPARRIRLRMPGDTSIRGLRKFPRNVSILLSSKLRRQVARATEMSLKDLDEGNAGSEPGWDLGMLCSLSIPIITIVALILLMIFVQLLNIIFWWLPFFKICLPIPRRSP